MFLSARTTDVQQPVLFFILRVSALTTIEPLPQALPEGIAGYRVQGSLFFGSVGKLDALAEAGPGEAPRALLLDLHYVMNMDTTAMDAMRSLHKALAQRNTGLVLCALQPQPRSLMERSGFYTELGQDNVQPDLAAGLRRAGQLASGI